MVTRHHLSRFLFQLASDLRDIFIDPHCLVCNSPLADGEIAICNDCVADSHLFDVPHLTTPHSFLDYKLEHICRIHGASALMIYKKGGISQQLIHNLKYNGCRRYAQFFGRIIAERITSNSAYSSIDYIVPVPIHRRKELKRGYNQSVEICRSISSITGIPLSSDNLIRFRHTSSQAGSSVSERLTLRHVFKVNNPSIFNNKKILLIDDVFTSGSTIIDCCRALESVPNLDICIYTIAYAEE